LRGCDNAKSRQLQAPRLQPYKRPAGSRLNEHIEGEGDTVFRHACGPGLEGIVAKRKDSAYRSGSSK
jgi:bifunctional non-homologous end joining protein LigD